VSLLGEGFLYSQYFRVACAPYQTIRLSPLYELVNHFFSCFLIP
jgi:hypothetical protein